MMPAISPCLWFDGKAEEAARFYTSVLPNSRIDAVLHYTIETPGGKPGDVMLVEFTLAGQRYHALNGGPSHPFTPAISLMAVCKDQAEVDRVWDLLGDGGAPVQCGWLTDRYGVSWQVVPAGLLEMIKDPDPEKVRRTMEAMIKMIKLDLATLQSAFNGETVA